MLRLWFFLTTLLLGVVQAQSFAAREDTTVSNAITGGSTTNSVSYGNTLAAIQQKKNTLLQQYENAGTDSARGAVLRMAGEQFVRSVAREITPFWYGTPWDFNGTTEVPGTGLIACGYFVTTVLRDVGCILDRVRLAQQPSEGMIRNLVGSGAIKRFSDVPIERFLAIVREWGEGLYVVGLDIHVGFIVYDDGVVRFIHSSYMNPLCVLQEEAVESAILAGSRYRVLGKLTADSRFLLSWLKGDSISAPGR